MIRCVICDHGLREMIHFEPDYENVPYWFVDVCVECYEKMTKRYEEMKNEAP